MKTPFLLLLSLFSGINLSAQTWPLIQNGRIGNYRHSSESLISNHIWVDSVLVMPRGDSVFYLNRIARLFFDVEPPDDVVDFGLTNQQQFLQRQVRKGADEGIASRVTAQLSCCSADLCPARNGCLIPCNRSLQ